jgi:hypothetical protein
MRQEKPPALAENRKRLKLGNCGNCRITYEKLWKITIFNGKIHFNLLMRFFKKKRSTFFRKFVVHLQRNNDFWVTGKTWSTARLEDAMASWWQWQYFAAGNSDLAVPIIVLLWLEFF